MQEEKGHYMHYLLLGLLLVSACSKNGNTLIIQNKGSDTIVNLAQAWAEEYKTVNPNVALAVSGGGSGTGIAALINGTVDIANSSRRISKEEAEEVEKNNGQPVKEFIVGVDALAVFGHPKNPIEGMTLEELACVYGEGGTCIYWHDIRGTVVPGCKDNKIIRISRQSNSGTYQYFRDSILGKKRDLKLGSMDLTGSREAIDLVEKTPCAIGYSGMGYLSKHVKSFCISKAQGEACVHPTVKTAVDNTYLIARNLYMYTIGEPSKEVQEYMKWTDSEVAQQITIQAGYVPAVKR